MGTVGVLVIVLAIAVIVIMVLVDNLAIWQDEAKLAKARCLGLLAWQDEAKLAKAKCAALSRCLTERDATALEYLHDYGVIGECVSHAQQHCHAMRHNLESACEQAAHIERLLEKAKETVVDTTKETVVDTTPEDVKTS